jgi:hypothetical protein
MDFIKATARGFRWLFVGVRQRTKDVSYDDKLGRMSTGAGPGIGAGSPGRSKLSDGTDDDTEYGTAYKPDSVIGGVYGSNPAAGGSAYELQPRPPMRMGSGDDASSDKLALLDHQQGIPGSEHGGHFHSGMSTPRASQQHQRPYEQPHGYGQSPSLRPYNGGGVPAVGGENPNWPLGGGAEMTQPLHEQQYQAYQPYQGGAATSTDGSAYLPPSSLQPGQRPSGSSGSPPRRTGHGPGPGPGTGYDSSNRI